MKTRSTLYSVIFLLWLIGTNHCAFECFLPASDSNKTSDDCQRSAESEHGHDAADTHTCGTPCTMADSASAQSELNLKRISAFSDYNFARAIVQIVALHEREFSIVFSIGSETEFSPTFKTSVAALIDAPNAPPMA